MNEAEIIIVGAGAAGLMAARELSKAGKKVIILEAQDRIGGRIWPLPVEEFGYPAQGGAEFVHGEAPITKRLLQESGLTYTLLENEDWDVNNNKQTIHKELLSPEEQVILNEKFEELKEDVPVSTFLSKYFNEDKFIDFKKRIIKIAEEYDAADADRISTFTLRDEWLGGHEWQTGIISEGYGAFLKFIETEVKNDDVDIYLDKKVESIEVHGENIVTTCGDGDVYESKRVIITLSIPTISSIKFTPAIPEKIEAASRIGFGSVIKILLKFNERWWLNSFENDPKKIAFLISDEMIPTWWEQRPEFHSVLIGWIAGPGTEKFKDLTSDEVIDLSIISLANIFKIGESKLRGNLTHSRVINWAMDQFSGGAYSYETVDTQEARNILVQPIDNKIFFAGEALYSGKETATVEGALGSGLETAQRILNLDN